MYEQKFGSGFCDFSGVSACNNNIELNSLIHCTFRNLCPQILLYSSNKDHHHSSLALLIKGALRSFGEEMQTFHNWINKLFSEENKVPRGMVTRSASINKVQQYSVVTEGQFTYLASLSISQ